MDHGARMREEEREWEVLSSSVVVGENRLRDSRWCGSLLRRGKIASLFHDNPDNLFLRESKPEDLLVPRVKVFTSLWADGSAGRAKTDVRARSTGRLGHSILAHTKDS